MLRSRKNIGKHNLRCPYGCCMECGSKKQEKRILKRKENIEWKKEASDN